MQSKFLEYFALLPTLVRKSVAVCMRIQRRVNRQHNSLTVDVVKRPELDG